MESTSSSTGPISLGPSRSERYYPTRSVVLSPLSFDRVGDGRPVTSQTLLFRLPIELVQEVVAYLNTSDLRSLALVDRDCRQLAQSRLFTSILLDYSDKKRALLDKLSHHEAQSRRDNGGVTESPSIGPCIRRVTVTPRPWKPISHHWVQSPADGSIGKEKECAMHGVVGGFRGSYLLDIAEALRFSLPNLDEFIWRERIEFTQHILTAIASSPIRHLGLHGVWLPLDREYQLPPLEQQRWALRSLSLRVGSNPHNNWRGWEVNNFFLTILKAAAPTLEKLSWRGHQKAKLSFDNNAIRFPRLRTLSFSNCILDDTALDAFFPADTENYLLRSISVNVRVWRGWESLAQCGRIRGLESLRLYAFRSDPPDSKATDAALFSATPRLKSLTLLAFTPENLTTTLLPLLASEFKFLTTLIVYFTFTRADPSSEFLAAIGRITSLSSLWVVAGRHHDWSANVPLTIAALSPLRNLARLGLSRQYTTVFSLVQEPEGQYQERMRNIVELYVRAFRELRWVYFELLVHRVVGNAVVTEEGGLRRYSPAALWETPDW